MYAQCNVDWNKYHLLDIFINHKKNTSALSVEDQQIIVKGQDTLRKPKDDWDIYFEWKDGSTLWEKLSNLKESHPI